MATTTEPQSSHPEPLPPAIEADISQFIRIDVEMKRAKKQMKTVRETLDMHRQHIIEYMVRTGTDKLVGINGGTQYLECVNKTLKKRPTSEQMLATLAELVRNHVTDPAAILEAIQNCGGTYTDYRLSRRTRRVNAATMVAAVVAANKKKKHRHGTKKRPPVTAEAAQSS